jgi:hypothetical protein
MGFSVVAALIGQIVAFDLKMLDCKMTCFFTYMQKSYLCPFFLGRVK